MDRSHIYIFVFAGNWNQFREWCRRTGYDETMMKLDGEHVVYVDSESKWRALPWSAYANGEVRTIGTFWEDAQDRLKTELRELESRISAARSNP